MSQVARNAKHSSVKLWNLYKNSAMTKEIINAGAWVYKRLRSGILRNRVYMLGSPIEDTWPCGGRSRAISPPSRPARVGGPTNCKAQPNGVFWRAWEADRMGPSRLS